MKYIDLHKRTKAIRAPYKKIAIAKTKRGSFMHANFWHGLERPMSAITIAVLVMGLVGFTPAVTKAATTGFQVPSVTHSPNNWDTNTVANVQSSNDVYATDNDEDEQGYANFGFSVPAGSTISGIEVKVEAKASDTSGCQLETRLSWNNGSSNTSVKTSALTGTETVHTLGGSADTWGRTWASGEFTGANFVVKVAYDDASGNNCSNGTTLSVDQIQASVTYTEPTPIVTNPTLGQSCGLDIALVLDSSGSVDTTELGQMKDAFEEFVNAFLPGTPTQFSVTDFDTEADVLQSFTNNTSLINSAINAPASGGFTNWEDGLLKAQSTLPNRVNPNLVVFASDGNPNRKGNPAQTVSEGDAVEAAKLVANSLKTSGTRILALGIGNDLDVENLKAISGPNVDTGSTSDVITSDFSSLAVDLAQLADDLCGGTITVTKIVDQDGNLQTTQDQTPGEGWDFDVAGTPKTTDANGQTQPVEVDQGTYSVTESPEPGYAVVDASCSGATNNGSFSQNTISGIQVGSQDIVACTFYNSPLPGTLTVIKQIINDNDGQITDPASFTIAVSGGDPDSFPGDANGTQVTVPAGANYSVSEPDSLGYGVTLDGDCQGVMPAGGQQTCTVINNDPEPTTGSLTVIKEVVNDNGGEAESGEFTLTLTDDQQNVTNLTSGQPVELAPGAYTVGETGGPSGYTGTIGTGDGDDCDADGIITIIAGEVYTCTITNNDQPGTLIVEKELINDNGGTMAEDDFSFVVNDDDAIAFEQDGSNQMTVNAGTYSVEELAASGYETTYENCDDVVVANGQTQTCTITNDDIQPKLTVTKVVTNDNEGDSEVSDFDLFVGQTTVSSGVEIGLDAGTYVVSESGPSGYSATFDGDCDGEGEVSLAIGGVYSCTITNDDNAPNTFNLTVTTNGDGEGVVTGEGINCDSNPVGEENDCSEIYASGTEVTLTADPDEGSNFDSSWSGACTGNNLTCQITINQNQSVNAHFALNSTPPPPSSPPSSPPGGGGPPANFGSISGTVYHDANSNGAKDTGEANLLGWTVYLDSNNNGVKDTGEPSATSDVNGVYGFNSLSAGTYIVREVLQSGWSQTAPAGGSHSVSVGSSAVTGKDFGNLQGQVLGVSTGPAPSSDSGQVLGVATQLPRTGFPVEWLYALVGLAALIPSRRKKRDSTV